MSYFTYMNAAIQSQSTFYATWQQLLVTFEKLFLWSFVGHSIDENKWTDIN